MLIKSLVGAVAALVLASAAQAQVAVSIWTGQSVAANDATLARAPTLGTPAGTPTATTTVSAINFNSAIGGYTVGGFLNNPVGLLPAVATAGLNDTYMLFTGSVFLNAGNNSFVVAHDDGLQLNITGIGLVVNQPGPTAPVNTPFNVLAPATGVYSFQLSYGECCGPPAQLIWTVNQIPVGVPEPATWGMMLLGFGGIGMAMRRSRRRPALSQIA